ncbi:MAG TPA: hypothetical protein VD861_09385, partial [Pyrinomonadaceae bacterium]|nr:hypothetical protein [Pyrinomonadaceae bacterium]
EMLAEEVRTQADTFEQAARAAEDTGRQAAASVKDGGPGIVDEERKRSYTGNAFEALGLATRQVFADLRDRKITTAQAQQKTEQLAGLDGLDSVQSVESRNQAQLRYTANQAAENAKQARAAANGAQETARDAQTAAKKSREDAQQARNKFEDCIGKVAAGCQGLARDQQTATTQPQERPETINILFNTSTSLNTSTPTNPCEQLKIDCDKLRFEVANLESQLTQAQAVLEAARKRADKLEAEAQKAEESARRAAEAAKGLSPGGGRIIDESRGRIYTESDFAARRAAVRQVWQDYGAGKITAEQAQQRAQELTGLDSLDRIQGEVGRKLYEAGQTAKKATEARMAANAARAASQAALARLAALQQALLKARADLAACLKKLEEACKRQKQAGPVMPSPQTGGTRPTPSGGGGASGSSITTPPKPGGSTGAGGATRPPATTPPKQDNTAATGAESLIRYFLDNIRALKLLPELSEGFDEFLVTFLTEDEDTASLMGKRETQFRSDLDAIYDLRAKLTNACTPSKMREEKLDQLETMKNSRTGRIYTAAEAEVKLKNICDLLRKLKSRVERLKR